MGQKKLGSSVLRQCKSKKRFARRTVLSMVPPMVGGLIVACGGANSKSSLSDKQQTILEDIFFNVRVVKITFSSGPDGGANSWDAAADANWL